MSFAVCIVSPPGYIHSEAFREVAESIHHGLVALGHDSILTYRVNVPGRRQIVFGSNLAAKMGLNLADDSVLYNLEQVERGSTWLDEAHLALLKRHTVWDYSRANIAELKKLGVKQVRHVPIGYVPALTRLKPAPEEVDVLFAGSMNERRQKVLDALARKGVTVERLFGVYGAQRDERIARARIVLNLHYYDAKVFEIARVSYLLANQRFVVSERGKESEEEAAFAPGVAFADYDRLVDTCVDYLGRPEDRRRIAAAGFELMRGRPVDLKDALR